MTEDIRTWFDGLQSRGIRPGLDSITSTMHGLGDPQKGLRVIHVAGSDGKGSVCAMLDSILRSSGASVGLFTTPHILSVNECIKVDGSEITDGEFDSVLKDVRNASSGCEITNFEALTAAALHFFGKKNVDYAIIEVGMGGRLDATNIVEPVLTIINNISLEHTAFLGSTIEEIAREKAGIMKPGVPCITLNEGPAFDVIAERSAELGCDLVRVDPDEITMLENMENGILIRYGSSTYKVGLPGRYQARNAAVAIEAATHIDGLSRTQSFIVSGLESVGWPDRMEPVEGTAFISDVTHTKKGAECLREDVSEIYGKVTVVLGMLSDKDIDGVVSELSKVASRFLVSAPDSPRATSKEILAEICRRYSNDVSVFDTIGKAAEAAMKYDGKILVTGSFRTAEDFRRWLATKA